MEAVKQRLPTPLSVPWPYVLLTRPGRQIALAPPAGIANPLKLHSISSVLKALGL